MSETIERTGETDVFYEDQMQDAYIDYTMSVLLSRAIPDVRDGLKPVHRRIIYAMHNGDASSKHVKSAAVVGDVMKLYHPHGDSSIYDALVRLAQNWKQRCVLIDGQGNFGNTDNDPPAAMRYTESRMARLAKELVVDIDKETVAFRLNYDESTTEPVVLPARYPNVLVNGGSGIAVGMASNMPTHNLREVIDATLLFLERDDVTLEQVMAVMPGPDFPTRGIIYGRSAIRQAYETGRGMIPLVGVASIVPASRGRSQIVVTELPYDVVKGEWIEKVVELVNGRKDKNGTVEPKITGITNINDESDRDDPVRVVIDVAADTDPAIVLNGLRRFTNFEMRFAYNATCVDSKGEPREMSVREILSEFVAFRRQTVKARTQFELNKARYEQTKQIGLYAAVSLIDEVVRTIRSSSDADAARSRIMQIDFPTDGSLVDMIVDSDPDAVVGATFRMSETQADAVVAMRLSQLTGLEQDKIVQKARELGAEIKRLLGLILDPVLMDGVIRNELLEIREKYGTDRLTVIEDSEADEIDDESLIERKDVIVTLTASGYVKRTDIDAFRAQARGGKGKSGMETKDDDFVVSSAACHTLSPLLVFTNLGRVYGLKAYRLQDAAANGRGRPMVNYIEFLEGEKVASIVALPDSDAGEDAYSLVFVTDRGKVRRNAMSDFTDLRKGGKNAMKLDEGIRLVAVLPVAQHEDILLSTRRAMCVRFAGSDVRVMQSRDSMGVAGIVLKGDDAVVSACTIPSADVTPLERDVYLAGGVWSVREIDLLDDSGNPKPVAASLTVSDPVDGRRQVVLSGEVQADMRRKEAMLLSVSESGFGKRSSSHEYRATARGGMGLKGAEISDRTGEIVVLIPVEEQDDIVLTTNGGQTIRTRVSEISVLGRSTRGVRLFNLGDDQKIVAVSRISNVSED